MNTRIASLTFLAVGLMLAIASVAEAQLVQQRPIISNPFRTGGGSCVYDRTGKLVHTPRGKECRSRSDEVDDSALGLSNAVVEGFPTALQADLRELLSDHVHISQELARLRQTIESGERAEALAVAAQMETKVADHRRREEELLAKLSKRAGRR